MKISLNRFEAKLARSSIAETAAAFCFVGRGTKAARDDNGAAETLFDRCLVEDCCFSVTVTGLYWREDIDFLTFDGMP